MAMVESIQPHVKIGDVVVAVGDMVRVDARVGGDGFRYIRFGIIQSIGRPTGYTGCEDFEDALWAVWQGTKNRAEQYSVSSAAGSEWSYISKENIAGIEIIK